MAQWKPTDGYFGTLLAALRGQALRRVDGRQDAGGTGGIGAGKPVNADTALQLSAVWACVRIIAEAIGAMPIRVWRIDEAGNKSLASDHWLNILFNSPNRHQTRNEFFETLVINLLLAGNSYVRYDRNAQGRVTSMMPMMATQTEVTLTRDGARTYAFTSGVKVAVFGQDAVWHVPLMPSNGVVGLSPLEYGARTMGIAMAAEDRVATLAANGFKPSGVLMLDKTLKPEQRVQIREQFSDLAEGQGDPLKVLEAGMKYQQISLAPKDVQLLETRRFSTEDIARFFGVPSVLINDTSASTVWGTGIGEIKEGFYTLTIQPLLERLESSISKWLIPNSERRTIRVEFDFSRLLRGSEATRVDTMTKAVTGNLLTIDEARERFDELAPAPDGVGSRMYAQSQMIPIGSAAEGEANDDA